VVQTTACFGRPDKHLEFFDLYIADQHKRFRTLSVEEQVDIYIEAMKKHPPDLQFAHDIVDTHGIDAVPVVLARLPEQESEALQCDLIRVLEMMAEPGRGTFDQETVNAVTGVVKKMRWQSFRERAEKSLATIRSAAQKPAISAPPASPP